MIVRKPSRGAPRLHVIYRSYGGENLKSRPAYYSKLLALTSLLRAAQHLDDAPDLTFLNDGAIPADRLDLMRQGGEIVPVDGGSNRRAYRAAINLAARRPWADDDLVWFAEDDYLYRPDSLRTLLAGAEALPEGDYFSLYSPADIAAGRSHPTPGTAPWPPSSDGRRGLITVGDTRWFRAMGTTSTFGVRAGALRQDRRLLRICPYTGGAWDQTSCLAVQGQQPFGWAELLPFTSALPASSWARTVVRRVTGTGVNLRSRRRPEHRRTLYAADPLPIWHLETAPDERPEDGARWALLAEQTRAWAQAQQIHLPADVSLPTEATAG